MSDGSRHDWCCLEGFGGFRGLHYETPAFLQGLSLHVQAVLTIHLSCSSEMLIISFIKCLNVLKLMTLQNPHLEG